MENKKRRPKLVGIENKPCPTGHPSKNRLSLMLLDIHDLQEPALAPLP